MLSQSMNVCHCQGSIENSKHFYSDSHIPLFFSFFCDPCSFYLATLKILDVITGCAVAQALC